METDYNTKKELKRRRQLRIGAFGIWTTGSLIALYGLAYPIINTPSQPPVLERYEEIERRFTSRNLELSIAHANELRSELSEIESTLGFAQVRERYEREYQSNKNIGFKISLGGIGLALLCSVPLFLSRKKTRKRSSIGTPVL